jgi:hypothetical protein
MPTRRLIRTIAYVLFLIAGVVYASLGTYARWKAYETRKNAEILLSEVRKLRPGEATIADVERVARIQNRFLMKGSPSQRGNVQYFDFRYDNGLLSQLCLAPRTVFGGRLQVVESKLDVSMMGMNAGKFPHYYSADSWDFTQESYPGDPGYRLIHRDQWVSVRLMPSATAEQRRRAYSFNLKCLDKIGGCHDAKELLPGPWETTK